MDENPFPDWFLWVAIGWVALIILLSVLARKGSGKPIVPKVPPNAFYADTRASGSMASNSLIVAVTPEALTVIPKFPFNLMFLPEIYRLEHTIPIAAIRDVAVNRNRWGNNVNLSYGPHGRELGLNVRDPEALVAALERLRSA
jgi:hypothetical protein